MRKLVRMKKGAIDFKQLALVTPLECYIYIYTWQRDQDIPSQVVIVFVNLNYDQDELNVWPGSTGVRQFSKDSAARWIRRIIVQVSLCASYFCSSPLLCSTSLNSSRFIPTCTSNATSSFVVKLFFLGFEYDNRNIDQLLLSYAKREYRSRLFPVCLNVKSN